MINEFTISNFRKIKRINYQFNNKNLLITVKNAQWKTSIDEALLFCAFLYSPNTKNKSELISFEEPYAMINIKAEHDIKTMLTKKELKVSLDNLEIKSPKEMIGKFKVLYLDPQTIKLVEDSSGIRRHFININISQTNIEYFDLLTTYNKLLKQKRKLLKTSNVDIKYLKLLNEQMLIINELIINIRLEYLSNLNILTQTVCNWLSGNKETISYEYKPSNYEENIEAKEIKYKTALWGNHLDKIDYLINQLDVRTFASQGQKRTLSLALNIAQMEIIYQESKEYPLVIFDDIFSEIDHSRQEKLYKLINEKSQLIMITPQVSNISPHITKHEKLDTISINNGEIL